MAIVNSLTKDSRWLQLEVCREFQRNKCTRPDTECKFAHPPATVEVQNGRVVACYDSIKGRCSREKPPCKYFHPPQHLKDQLLINGRNHLALKQALMQSQIQPHMPVLGAQLPITGPVSTASILAAFAGPSRVHQESRLQRRKESTLRVTGVGGSLNPLLDSYAALRKQASSNPYMASIPAMAAAAYGSYPLTLIPGLMSTADQLTNAYGVMSAPPAALMKSPQRTDRLEICREFLRGNCKRPDSDCRFAHPPEHVQVDASGDGLVTVCMDFLKGRCSRDSCRYLHPPAHLQAQLKSRAPSEQANPFTQTHSLLPLLPQHLANNRSPFRL